MYTTTSKQQEGCTFKDSHPKCFITTNFDKFHFDKFNILNHDDTKVRALRARASRERAKSFHACVFLLSNSEKLRENIQNNTKTKQH